MKSIGTMDTSDVSSEIASFPVFSPVDPGTIDAIRPWLAGVQHVADFNLVELWCWIRGRGDAGVSQLNGNLVVRWPAFPTHDTGEADLPGFVPDSGYLSVLPRHQVERTILDLLAYTTSSTVNIQSSIRAIPLLDATLDNLSESGFVMTEDRDNFDYMISVHDWARMAGGSFRNKRNVIHRLERATAIDWRISSPENREVAAGIPEVIARWADQRGRDRSEVAQESTAIANLLDHAPSPGVFVVTAFADDVMIGFSINEVVDASYAVGHFAKADYRFPGLSTAMLHRVCLHLAASGVRMLNIEADLGDPGLRRAKMLLRPSGFLRKVMVAPI
ncbi:MAG TPA: phosphatidylglycerol lysyltransferase domain-containing protein [Thermomicrobiales bacterium]|nr:phosphatidylglycerol lysyltransferase domain-containing protein [Thermomicrobiales bacterium]